MRFLLLTVLLALTRADGDVELTFQPPGDTGGHYRRGTYVSITCRVKSIAFDLTQVVKINSAGDEFEISTNDFLSESFKTTGRYSLMSSSQGEYKETRISIKELRGADSGTIECRHTLLNGTKNTATELFKVLVPPESVEILQYDSGVTTVVPNGGDLVLREGEDHGVICRVKVLDSEGGPTVDIKLGEDSILSTFSKEEERTESGPDGVKQHDSTILYDRLTASPDINENGKTLTCSAAMEGYEELALNQSVNIKVHYAPRLNCEAAHAIKGSSTNITCTVQTSQEVELLAVSWNRNPDRFDLNLDEPDHERHHLRMTPKGDGLYELRVLIDEVMGGDFGSYVFEVQNAHSPSEKEVALVEVVITQPPAPVPEPESTPESKTDPPIPGSSPGGAPRFTAQLFVVLVLLSLHVFH